MTACEWPGCPQTMFEGRLCYWHTKVASGLTDGRSLIQVGKNGRKAQAKLLDELERVGAPEAVIEANAEPIHKGGSSISGGGDIPRGRLHLS